MKFHLAINLERMQPQDCMKTVQCHTLDMVQMADQAGFEIAWAAEHHALEMTIAPNPFQLLTWWAAHTDQIRLGSGVVNAAYWHPINLAGEAAMLDLMSGGRLEFGIGSGAYQREFDRMRPGLDQKDGWRYMQEMLPCVLALWQGDYEHEGDFWQFPVSTSCPKPVQPEVPVWVAARSPITFDYAIENDCNIMSWPLTLPFSEAEAYKAQRQEAIDKKGNGYNRKFAMMRHTSVYTTDEDALHVMNAVRGGLARFGNLMMKAGEVRNGFADEVSLDKLKGNVRVDPAMLEENLIFGSPDTVIEKLKRYEDLGIDSFIYYTSMGLDRDQQQRSLKMFCDEVVPAFA
ncbi:MAG: LLM class flavin-dependent oxidoreductase [Pseudomonadota bacterium]